MARTFLMSPPASGWRIVGGANYKSVAKSAVNPRKALEEWIRLADAITAAGGSIAVLPPQKAPALLTGLMYTANAGWLAAGDDKGNIQLWHLPGFSGAPRRPLAGMEDLRAMAWSGDGALAAVDAAGHLIAMRPPARKLLADVSLGADDVQALQWMPDGDAVVTGGKLDGTLQLTSLTGQTLKPLDRLHREAVTALAVSLDGKRLLSADASGSARLWDIATRAADGAVATGAGRGTAGEGCIPG